MRVLGPTSVDAVRQHLGAGRDLRSGSAPWTLQFLDIAEAQFAGAWADVELTGPEALQVRLPAHAGEPCRGDQRTLIGPEGLSVGAAADRLRGMASDYARDNPTCWSRIREAAEAPFSPVILTTAPLDRPEYRGLTLAAGDLVHLDGFHRLIAWALADRLTSDAIVRAAVAGARGRQG